MSNRSFFITMFFSLLMVGTASAQRPPHRGSEWFERFDTSKNGAVEREEFTANADAAFEDSDQNNDGAIDDSERPQPPPPLLNGERDAPPSAGRRMPPPFMMRDENRDGRLTRAEFDENVRRSFVEIDADGDGEISRGEAEAMKRNQGFQPPPDKRNQGFQPPPPNAEFLGAEMRFGDKLIKNAPFSAETVMEHSRRLFDGSTATTQSKGAIYRDGAGRTRREQPLETIGAFSFGSDAPKLIFITDANEGIQYFLDLSRQTARKIPLSGESRPPKSSGEKGEAKTESLGKKVLEGVSVEGTRTTVEIPAGKIGNDKPLQITSERWFSADLQTVVMSRHVDPLLGEQVFRLTNIRRVEPARELFTVPTGFRVETDRQPR